MLHKWQSLVLHNAPGRSGPTETHQDENLAVFAQNGRGPHQNNLSGQSTRTRVESEEQERKTEVGLAGAERRVISSV